MSTLRGTALVLGGGGLVGLAWQLGLFDSLRKHGARPGEADLVLGTSAGAVTGALLLRDDTSPSIIGTLHAAATRLTDGPAQTPAPPADPAALLDAIAASADLGRLALDAPTMPEQAYVRLFTELIGTTWPSTFACTGIDADTGETHVWRSGDTVPLAAAVAASCAVPLSLPVVTVGDHRCMDGGLHDPLHAHLATGYQHVVAVSCFPVTTAYPGAHPAAETQRRTAGDALAALRADGTRVELIEPDQAFLTLSAGGAALMDPSRIPLAYQLGTQLGTQLGHRARQAFADRT